MRVSMTRQRQDNWIKRLKRQKDEKQFLNQECLIGLMILQKLLQLMDISEEQVRQLRSQIISIIF